MDKTEKDILKSILMGILFIALFISVLVLYNYIINIPYNDYCKSINKFYINSEGNNYCVDNNGIATKFNLICNNFNSDYHNCKLIKEFKP